MKPGWCLVWVVCVGVLSGGCGSPWRAVPEPARVYVGQRADEAFRLLEAQARWDPMYMVLSEMTSTRVFRLRNGDRLVVHYERVRDEGEMPDVVGLDLYRKAPDAEAGDPAWSDSVAVGEVWLR